MALKFDSDGWLIPGVHDGIQVNTEHRTQKGYKSGYSQIVGGKPIGVVWHWANAPKGDGRSENLRKYMLQEVVNPEREASWHFFIDRYGRLYQHASLTMPTWHVGNYGEMFVPFKVGKYAAGTYVPVGDINKATIGVELENAGILVTRKMKNAKTGKDEDVYYGWPYATHGNLCSTKAMCNEVDALNMVRAGTLVPTAGYAVTRDRVEFSSRGVPYDRYLPEQVKTARELARALKDHFKWTDPRQIHYSHEQYVPKQKLDPGPLWMDKVLPEIEIDLFGRRADNKPFIRPLTVVGGVLLLGAVGGGYWWWNKKGRPLPQFIRSRLPARLRPQLAALPSPDTVGGTMGLLDGILNGGFFTGQRIPAGFGNLGAPLPPIDGTHTPFKRSDKLPGLKGGTPREEQKKWQCEWQEVGTGRPDGSGKTSRPKDYSSEQICTPIGEEAEKHKEGYTKIVRIRKATKSKYNEKYKKEMKKEEDKGKKSRGFPNKPQSNYEKRKTGWPKFENNPTFAKRLAREQKAQQAAAAEKAAQEAAKAEKAKAKAEKAAAKPAEPKKQAAPKQAKQQPKQAKQGKKAASA